MMEELSTQIIDSNDTTVNLNGSVQAADKISDMDMEEDKVFAGSVDKKGWRNQDLDLKGNLMNMLENSIYSDMTFLVGENKDCVTAHKFILSLWSSAFEYMPDTVEIPEINPVAFKSFLKFLYVEEFEVANEDLMPVLCAAKRFEIPLLAEKCVSVLKSEIKDNTAVSMYQAGKMLNEESLAEESLNYILKNGSDVLKDDDFLVISYENLCYILERDDFEAEETEIFEAVYRWGLKECKTQELEANSDNLRMVLKGAVKLIRFPLMTAKDFALHVAPTEMLTDKEMITLLIQYSIPASERIGLPVMVHSFVDRERKSNQPPKKKAKVGRPSFPEKTPVITLDDDSPKQNGAAADGDWRSPRAGLKFNLMTLFENSIMNDVTFLVGPNKEKLLAHKFILTLWSAVFEGMFHNKEVVEEEVIELPEINAEGFRSFLKVLYTENFDVAVENVMSVYFIAKMYEIGLVGEKCVNLLKSSIGDNTAVSVFQAGKMLNDESLASIAWQYILNRGHAVVKESDFLQLSHANLLTLLEQNDLNVGETELFQGVMRWAANECDKRETVKTADNLREILKSAIQLIRFPLMSIKDFSLIVAPTEILTDKEMVGVLIYYSLPPSERANSYRLAFSCKERKVKTTLVKERLSLCNLSLMSDRTVSIGGLSFSGVEAKKLGYSPNSIYLYNSKKGMSYATSYTETTVVDEGKDRIAIKFKMPIIMKPNEWYISSEMTLGRQGAAAVNKENWVTVKSRQKDVNFQFQVHPIRETDGVFEYAMPEVIFNSL